MRELEEKFAEILGELRAMRGEDFVECPDSLSMPSGGYDERGWRYYALFGDASECERNRERCPATAAACRSVPGLVNAGFSLFRPGTHLRPHRGERKGILRCHLPLVVPSGDCGIRFGNETRRWTAAKCLVFDDTFEHDAWNRGEKDRVVLIVSFERAAAS